MMKRVSLAVSVGAVLWSQAVGAQFAQQGGKLVGTGAVGSSWQASAVAVSADGRTAILGGYLDNNGTGAAWVFTRSNGVWAQQGDKLVGTGSTAESGQGWSVAVSGDGNTAMIGGPGDNVGIGAAWVFTRSNGVWTQQGAKLVGGGASGPANQGSSVALSSDGNTAVVGGPGENTGVGAVWVFTRAGGVWTQQGGKLVGTGAVGIAKQGLSVALSADASTVVVGGPQDNNGTGAVWVFTRAGGAWTQRGNKLVGSTPTTKFTNTGNASVTASFTQQPPPCYSFSATVNPSNQGAVTVATPQTCPGGYTPGTQIAMSVFPVSGWTIAGWSGSGGSFSIFSFQTTFTITGNAQVTANLAQQGSGCFTLSTEANPPDGGGVTVDTVQNCTGGYTQGVSIQLTAKPAAGWTFAGWSGSGGLFANASSPTTSFTIAASASVTANFLAPSTSCYSLLVGAASGGGGSVTVDTPQNCSGGYAQGTEISLTANPVPGWTLSGWTGSGGSFSNAAGLVTGVRQGGSVAISGDGSTVIVGGDLNGSFSAVWVFSRSGEAWVQQGNPIPVSGEAWLGQPTWSVAVSGDGNTALVAEASDNEGTGATWVFARSGGVWAQQGNKLVGAGLVGHAEQGFDVALSADGSTAIVGGPGDAGGVGAAWIFGSGGSTPACTFGVSPAWQGFVAAGGTGTIGVSVVSESDCPWIAVSNAAWIAVTGGETGSGNGQVGYAVSTNVGVARSGTIGVGGQTFTVYQAGTDCSYSLDQAGVSVPGGGSTGSFSVSAPAGCPWTASTAQTWLHVTSGAAGVGPGAVSFTVDPNTAAARSGTIFVAGRPFTVSQAAVPVGASFTVTPGGPVVGEVLQFSDTSTGVPTSWSWDFGDGGISTMQSPTHTYAAAGAYTVVLNAANAATQSSASRRITVNQGFALWVPVVSHVAGANGTNWRTDIGLLNAGAAAAGVQELLYTPGGVVTSTVVVPAGGQVVVTDIVGELGFDGSGAMEIVSDQPLVVSSRTYDELASGTVGQGYASYGTGDGLGAGQSAWLPQLAESAAYRTNISETNTGGVRAVVTVTLFDGAGNRLASYEVTLAPGEWAQQNRPFFGYAGETAMDEGYATVTVTSGTGVVATASVVDNTTNDPTTVVMMPASRVTSAGAVWVPVVSHVAGANGTNWRTDIGLLNAGAAAAGVQELLYTPGGVVTGTVVVPAGGQVVVTDIVGELGFDGSGAMEIVSDQPLVVSSRTYDELASGTVGQGYASYGTGDGLGAGQSAWLPQLAESAAYRTNISETNTGGVRAVVTVTLFDGAGNRLASYEVTLAPGEWAQQNRPFFGYAGETAMDEGYATVTVTSGTGVVATASVVDNTTNDPTTVVFAR